MQTGCQISVKGDGCYLLVTLHALCSADVLLLFPGIAKILFTGCFTTITCFWPGSRKENRLHGQCG